MDHDEIHSMIAAYALGALDERDQRTVRDHIITCEECMVEADAYLQVADQLSTTVVEQEPPPGFADLVMAEIREDRPAVTPAPVQRTTGLWLRWLAAATSAAALVFGFLFIDARDDARTGRDALAQLVADGEGIELAGEAGRARLVSTDSGSMLVAADLPSPPDGMVYQLWLLGDANPVSAGVFGSSDGVILFESDRSIEGFEGAAVTFEPDGGSDQPTGSVIIASS
jgi:anti-sigma-K factor RskA